MRLIDHGMWDPLLDSNIEETQGDEENLEEQPCQKPLCGPVFLACILAARCRMLLGFSGDLHLILETGKNKKNKKQRLCLCLCLFWEAVVLSKLKWPVRFSRASGDEPPLPGDARCREV